MKLSTALSTPLFVRRTVTRCACFRTAMAATRITVTTGRDRVPPSRMPGGTLRQPHHSQEKAFDRPVSAQRFDCVFTAGGGEPAGRHPQGRHIRPVQLDTEDENSGGSATHSLQHRDDTGGSGSLDLLRERSTHGSSLTDTNRFILVRPPRNCLASSAELAVAAPGSARITTSVSGETCPTKSAQI